MANVTFSGNVVQLMGNLPNVGDNLGCLKFVGQDLAEVTINGRAIINLFPSIDTGVCAAQTREFNKRAAEGGLPVYVVSMDLPFALARFCGAEGIDKVQAVSDFRHRSMADKGMIMAQGPLTGLYARCVIVVNDGTLEYIQLVPEVKDEPDYDAVFSAI